MRDEAIVTDLCPGCEFADELVRMVHVARAEPVKPGGVVGRDEFVFADKELYLSHAIRPTQNRKSAHNVWTTVQKCTRSAGHCALRNAGFEPRPLNENEKRDIVLRILNKFGGVQELGNASLK